MAGAFDFIAGETATAGDNGLAGNLFADVDLDVFQAASEPFRSGDTAALALPSFTLTDGGLKIEQDIVRAGSEAEHRAGRPEVEIKDGRLVKVTYPDDRARQFGYDEAGRLASVTQPGGAVWTRQGEVWKTADGKSFAGELRVNLKGDYSYTSLDGVMKVFHADGASERIEPTRTSGDMQRIFEKNFHLLDQDGNGRVAKSEIDRAIQDQSFKGEDAQLIVVLKEHFDKLRGLKFDLSGVGVDELGVSHKDMAAFHAAWQKGDEDKLIAAVDATLRGTRAVLQNVNRDLFADTQNPLNSISADDIVAGRMGGGEYIDYIKKLVREHAEELPKLMYAGRGGYFVDFPDLRYQPGTILDVQGTLVYNPEGMRRIWVSPPTDAELALYPHNEKQGVWSSVLQKARGAYARQLEKESLYFMQNQSVRFADTESYDWYIDWWYREHRFAFRDTKPLHEKADREFKYVTPQQYEHRQFWSEVLLPGSTR